MNNVSDWFVRNLHVSVGCGLSRVALWEGRGGRAVIVVKRG